MKMCKGLFVAGVTALVMTITATSSAVNQKNYDTNDIGHNIYDPYRWMENGDEFKLNQWVKKQRTRAENYLEGELYQQIHNELIAGKNLKRSGIDETRIDTEDRFYKLKHQRIPLVDIVDARVEKAVSFSGRYDVLRTNNNYGDLQTLQIFDNQENKYLMDVLQVKFASVTWSSNDEFLIYTTDRDHRNGGTHMVLAAHRVGESTNLYDKIIWEASSPVEWATLLSTGSAEFLFVQNDEKQETVIYALNVDNQSIGEKLWQIDGQPEVVYWDDASIYFSSFDNHPNGEIIKLDLQSLKDEVYIPAYELPLDSISVADGNMFINYLEDDVTHRVMKYIPETKELKSIALPFPGIYRIYGLGEGQSNASSYSVPRGSLTYNDETLAFDLTKEAEEVLQNAVIDTKTIEYTLAGGQKSVIWLISKKGVKLNEKTPLYLYGYGGFKVNILPGYGIVNRYMPLIERGGAVAVVTLPGGLEKGENWHKLGNLLNKKNVFDAMASAAFELQQRNISSSDHMAIGGGSNGGLLVAATINKYPFLFKAAVPEVGVLDSLRYHKYTAGKWWVSEYGNPEDKKYFNYILSYSPYHNIKPQKYPSVLVMTGDGDDRVVPAHSYKYTAQMLDTLTTSYNKDPKVFLYTQKFSGHGGSADFTEYRKAQAARLTFLLKELR